jgi:hypothetical protein
MMMTMMMRETTKKGVWHALESPGERAERSLVAAPSFLLEKSKQRP